MASAPTSHRATIPMAIARVYPERATLHPLIIEVYHPDTSWKTLRRLPLELERMVKGTFRKRITPAYASKLRRHGFTHVRLDLGDGRRADFTTAELCHRWSRVIPLGEEDA